jgi:hypothetical protein
MVMLANSRQTSETPDANAPDIEVQIIAEAGAMRASIGTGMRGRLVRIGASLWSCVARV